MSVHVSETFGSTAILADNFCTGVQDMGVRRNFFRRGQRQNFAYHFQVADDTM